MTQALSPRELDRLREAAAAMNSALNNSAIEAVTASLPKVDLSAISEGLGATAALRTMAAVTPKFDTSVVSA